MPAARRSTKKLLAASLMATGLFTFFLPIITTDTPVHGRTEWAPVQLLVSRADLWRPAPDISRAHFVLYQVAMLYALMIMGLLVIAFSSPNNLLWIAIVGSADSVTLFRHGPRAFGWLFYGRSTHSRIWDGGSNIVTGVLFGAQGLRCDVAYVVLLLVMPLLAVIVTRREREPVGSAEDEAASRPLEEH